MATPIKLTIVVNNLDDVLAQGWNRIKVYRSTTGYSGVYSEITDATTRIAIASPTTVYEYHDESGDPSYYYRTAYFKTSDSSETNQSEPRGGADAVTDGILSVAELLNFYLFGVDLTNDAGTPYPDTLYEWYIRGAIAILERELDISLRPVQVTERYDYYRRDYQAWGDIKLRQAPVIDDLKGADLSVLQPNLTRVKMIWPSQSTALEFHQQWIQIREDQGKINLVPAGATLSSMLITAGGNYLSLVAGNYDYIPDLFSVTYTYGFRQGQVPQELRELVGMIASFGPLNIAGDLLGGAGIASQSIGIDGLSQSFNTTSSATNAGYGARLLQYERMLKQRMPTLRRYYKGIRMVAV